MKENNLRKAKVNELNRILPMVTNTMRKERKILCARDELAEKVLEENKVCQALKKVEEVPEILQNTSTDISGSSTLFAKLEEKKKSLEEVIDEYTATIEEISSEYEFEVDLYRSIAAIIATEGGFLKREEIQEKYIVEYIYLLLISDKLSLDTLMFDFDDIFERYITNLSSQKLGSQMAEEMLKKQNRAEEYREEAKRRLLSFALI